MDKYYSANAGKIAGDTEIEMETQHFQVRMRQRGISGSAVDAIRAFSDRVIPLRKHCTAEMVSKRRLQELAEEGILPPSMSERLHGLVLVVSPGCDDVTILKLSGPKAKFYTRDRRCRRERRSRRQARMLGRMQMNLSGASI